MGKRSPVKLSSANNGHFDSDGADDVTSKKPRYEVNDLLSKVSDLIEDFNYELALKFCMKANNIEPENTKVLETMGNISAELGNVDDAKQYLLKAVSLKPEEGHVKYLYLGQLSEGTVAVDYYKKAIDMMLPVVSKNKQGNVNDDDSLSSRDISNVYCSLAELYMTDCCMESDAEKLCESSCQQALHLDDENPEAHIVMCNFLLTKGDVESAKGIAMKLYDVWKTLSGQDDDNIVDLMSYESRMTLIKILIEVDLCDKVATIGVQLLEENEDDIRIWYYIGLSKSLLNEAEGQRYYLETAIYLYEKNNLEDEDMLSHLRELLNNCPLEEEETIEDEVDDEEQMSNSNQTSGMDVDG